MPTAICGYLKCLWNLTILLTIGSKSKLRFVLLTDILAQFSGNERFECKSGFGAIACTPCSAGTYSSATRASLASTCILSLSRIIVLRSGLVPGDD